MTLKRTFDIAVAAVGIVVTSPLLLTGVFISAASHKSLPLFFQQRVGLDGELFTIYKIKSMHNLYDADNNLLPNEHRTSWATSFLRKSRFDELPQLFNVLNGDMSIVGPRPLMLQEALSQDKVRQKVKPGCTGLSQINGHNTLLDEAKLKYDQEYVENLFQNSQFKSLMSDIKILAKTPLAPYLNGL